MTTSGVQLNPYLLQLVDEILFYEWDPIGVKGQLLCRDEYGNYARSICRLLADGADEIKLTVQLGRMAQETMGLPLEKKEHDTQIARRLLSAKECCDERDPRKSAKRGRQKDFQAFLTSDAYRYQHLERRPGSNYKQLFVKNRRIRAEVLYRQTIGLEPRTAEEVAEDYDLPLEAVEDAIQYCINNPEVLQEDRDREAAKIAADEKRNPHLLPPDQ